LQRFVTEIARLQKEEAEKKRIREEEVLKNMREYERRKKKRIYMKEYRAKKKAEKNKIYNRFEIMDIGEEE